VGNYEPNDDADRLDALRRGKPLRERPERTESVKRWIEMWEAMRERGGINFALIEFDLLDYIKALEAAVHHDAP